MLQIQPTFSAHILCQLGQQLSSIKNTLTHLIVTWQEIVTCWTEEETTCTECKLVSSNTTTSNWQQALLPSRSYNQVKATVSPESQNQNKSSRSSLGAPPKQPGTSMFMKPQTSRFVCSMNYPSDVDQLRYYSSLTAGCCTARLQFPQSFLGALGTPFQRRYLGKCVNRL
ncbi:Hypothetical_protein [Hexamita inflata]|uniref:Hypothetical_protein n=1 Tax=Hexamita inflata TaxID=28002 RepID=A0AA86U5L6_9EUKA|nr:Hypothetical protein HINF_LOCUS26417 [Hexamita inflata]